MEEITGNAMGYRPITQRKRSAAERMDEIRAMGIDCDPLMVLMEIAIGKKLMPDGSISLMVPCPAPKERAKAAAELASYIYPKRKAMEISGDKHQPIAFAVIQDIDEAPAIPASHAGQLKQGASAKAISGVIIDADTDSDGGE